MTIKSKVLQVIALLGVSSTCLLITGCDDEYNSNGPSVTVSRDSEGNPTGVDVAASVDNTDTGTKATLKTHVAVNSQTGDANATTTATIENPVRVTDNLTLTPTATYNPGTNELELGAGLGYRNDDGTVSVDFLDFKHNVNTGANTVGAKASFKF